MSSMQKDLILILPQIIILLSAVFGLIAEMFRKPRGSLWIIIAGMVAAVFLSSSRIGLEATAFSETFRIDALNHWSVIILGTGNVLFMLLARTELKGTDREGTVYSLLTFSTLAGTLLAGSGDLMFIVLGILMMGLSGFALAAYPKTDAATEGAMKYFIYGAVSGAIMLFGITYWVGITGSTLISEVSQSGLPTWALLFGYISILIGIGYAASVFPFHFWTPATFQGAPVSIATYLSVTPKIGALFALAQVTKDLPSENFNWQLIIAALSFLSMTIGNVMALLQRNIVRLLAYSTITQAGYFLMAVIAIQESHLATKALLVFGVAYLLMNTGAFAMVLKGGNNILDFNGYGKKQPFEAVAFTIFLLSLVGIPPLAGFAGKFLLFGAVLDTSFTWLAVAAIINSAISLAVYLRIIVPMFFSNPEKEVAYSTSKRIISVMLFCLVMTLIFGIFFRIIL